MLYAAALVIVALGLAHSFLGERFILIRLLRRGGLPKLFGGTEFTARTLRYAWHLTTVLAFGMAALLIELAGGAPSVRLAATVGWTLMLSAMLALILTRGRHLSWAGLVVAGALCLSWAAR